MSERFELETELSRDLKLTHATAIVVGAIIGSGIFGAPAGIADALRSPGLFLIFWIIGGVLAFCGALSMAELGAMMPRSGGPLVYLREAFPPYVAFFYGWMDVFLMQAGGIAAGTAIFASYLGYFVPWISPESMVFVAGPWKVSTELLTVYATLLLLGTVNYVGVRFGGALAMLTSVGKVAALVGFAVLAFFGRDSERVIEWFPAREGIDPLASFGMAMVGVFFAYNGWQYLNIVAGEVENPRRNLPLSIIIGLSIVTLVYFFVNGAYLSALTIDEIAASNRVAADAAERVLGPAGGVFVSVAVLISTFGVVNNTILWAPRVAYGMSREKLFFPWFSFVHPRFRTPSRAIVGIVLCSAVWSSLGSFQAIIDSFAFALAGFLLLTVIALFVLRRKFPDAHRPFKVWGYPYVPMFFVVVTSGYVVSVFVFKAAESLPGLLFLLLGVPVYFFWFRKRSEA